MADFKVLTFGSEIDRTHGHEIGGRSFESKFAAREYAAKEAWLGYWVEIYWGEELFESLNPQEN